MVDWIVFLFLLFSFVYIIAAWPEHLDDDHESMDDALDRLFGQDPDDLTEGQRHLFWSRLHGFYSMPVYDEEE
jgi:hypothetical protein